MSHSNNPETTDLYECANCGAVWTAEQLAPYHDFWAVPSQARSSRKAIVQTAGRFVTRPSCPPRH